MIVTVRRLFARERSTFGVLFFEGEQPTCFTLEDLQRAVKVPKETAIPTGRYELKLRTYGRLYERYRARYSWNEPGMLWLQAVPQFTDVLIHCGATDEDTHGCLLLGYRADVHRPSIAGSLDAYQRVYQRIAPELLKGERVMLDVVDMLHELEVTKGALLATERERQEWIARAASKVVAERNECANCD